MNIKHSFLAPFFAFGFASAFAQSDPVVMTIDGDPIYKSEFEYVYKKNNSTTIAEKKSVDEYVDLFINYKLKVLDAVDGGYDQKKSYQKELKQYRDQLAMPFVMDSENKNSLTREAYERLQKQVSCSHILIKFDSKDSVPPFIRISEIYQKLKNGADFAELAKKYSQCPSAQDGGYLGYVDCFAMVYDFENVIFNLKPGQFSEPFKTKFGYHIAKVSDVRPNVYKKRASHIFLGIDNPRAEAEIDSLYELVKKGADLNKLAERNNDLKVGGDPQGRLPWTSKGDMMLPPEISGAIMSLEKHGDMKKVQSRVGWHLIRLDSLSTDIPFEALKDDIEQRIMKSDRSRLVGDRYLAKLYDHYGVSVDSSSLRQFYDLARDKENFLIQSEIHKLQAPLFIVADETHPQSDFVNTFLSKRGDWNDVLDKKAPEAKIRTYSHLTTSKMFVDKIFRDYLDEFLVNKSFDDLQASNADFRNLLREYSDGLLLFEVSNDKVWNVASRDVEGLKTYFSQHSSKYKWSEPRFRGKIIYCADKKVQKKVDKFYTKYGKLDKDTFNVALKKEFNKVKGEEKVAVTDGTYVKGANPAVDYYVFKSTPSYTSPKEKFPEVLVYGNETYDPIDYKEVRGAVVADYQNKLDEDWIKSLREDHKVVVNHDVLKTIK